MPRRADIQGQALDIHGFCHERFAPVRDAFERNFTEYGDVGATFAATVEGEFVVDLWAGHADKARTRPWEEDTIVNVYSTTKTMSFLCAFVLADRGLLDFDAKVTDYWPEYGQNGKEATEVRHFMSHAAGVPGFEPKLESAARVCTTGKAASPISNARRRGGNRARRAATTR